MFRSPNATDWTGIEVTLDILVRRTGLMVLAASAPCIEPFRRIDRATEDLWIRLQPIEHADPAHRRFEFVTRRRPYTSETTPTPVARTALVRRRDTRLFELLGIQTWVDFFVLEISPIDGEIEVSPLSERTRDEEHFPAFIEPPSYDWDRMQTLCEQFTPYLRGRRRMRN